MLLEKCQRVYAVMSKWELKEAKMFSLQFLCVVIDLFLCVGGWCPVVDDILQAFPH